MSTSRILACALSLVTRHMYNSSAKNENSGKIIFDEDVELEEETQSKSFPVLHHSSRSIQL
uniref:Uncharacterized protein n=1 Tax=Ciona intestinalis TaxID=7719 RepID=H2XS40_CIOIN